MPLPDAVDRCTTDVFLHTWDLARTTGQDEQHCAGMTPVEELLRTSGQHAPAVPVPADVQTRLLAFMGRSPLRGGD